MNKYFKKVVLLFCVFLFTIVASAHSGKTDSNGGHTDSSTGKYHYHHGYPAHNHYDMDGDGDLDCPYEFDDKTNHGNSSNKGESKPNTSRPNSTTQKRTTAKDVISKIFSIIGISLAVLGIGICTFILPLLYWLLMTPIEWLIKRLCKENTQKSVLDKANTIMMIFIVVMIVMVVTIIVL